MKIIDAHLHFFNAEGFKKTAREISQVNYCAQGLKDEFNKANVVAGVVMTTPARNLGDPCDLTLEDGTVDSLFYCVGVNPEELRKNREELANIERELKNTRATGLKIYAGYFPVYVYDPVYEPIYDLARKYKVPVAIHTGDTQTFNGLLKYSHPLTIDELAVTHPDINFIICHFGVPWVLDTAELLQKNPNVYADLSGLIAGNREVVLQTKDVRLFVELVQQGLVYAHSYEKILFGTDWPLVPIEPYVEFVKHVVPEQYHEDVFYNNALKVYPKLKKYVINDAG
ncbi:MAG: amidohydrolase family protein [Clostridia bacterium]|nr:amidohydrolase family protein [Clostridia bacterium]